jgi:hypothetical protein
MPGESIALQALDISSIAHPAEVVVMHLEAQSLINAETSK